jgi:hypothetical protein
LPTGPESQRGTRLTIKSGGPVPFNKQDWNLKNDWRIITMTQFSSFPLFVSHNLKTRPQDFIINDEVVAQVERTATARRTARDAANPIKPEPARQELNRLRGQLFSLEQNAHATEVRVNHEIGNVRLYEENLGVVLKTKKQHEDAGNLLGARTYERQAQALENELNDARERLVKNRRYNTGAARELRTWQQEQGPRLLELKKEVASLPVQDGDSYAKELETSFKK